MGLTLGDHAIFVGNGRHWHTIWRVCASAWPWSNTTDHQQHSAGTTIATS
uniref:Uncharacterized protein n=1 Tax=Pseudomonas tritici TaxID=2745518 RepID=A0A8I0CZA8_9PSED